jgi:hypothetical protein
VLAGESHPLNLNPAEVRQARQNWPEGRIVPRYELNLGGSGSRSAADDSNTPAQVAGWITGLAQAGADGVVLGAGLDPEAAVRKLQLFDAEVAPLLRERGLWSPPS